MGPNRERPRGEAEEAGRVSRRSDEESRWILLRVLAFIPGAMRSHHHYQGPSITSFLADLMTGTAMCRGAVMCESWVASR